MRDYTIKDIESMNEADVLALDPEKVNINDHDVYLVDFEGYFGYSAVVFREGHHLYYANDYELHHKGSYMPEKSREELKQLYIDGLSNVLFSDDMIPAPVADYQEAERKEYYLRNYYPQMCEDKISLFFIGSDEEREAIRKKTESMYYSQIGFFWSNDKDFIDRLNDLYKQAIKSKEGSRDSYDYWFNAFKYEMYNHEYAINWDADCDTLSAFGLPYQRGVADLSLEKLFDLVNFSDLQRKAYREAARYVLNNSNY